MQLIERNGHEKQTGIQIIKRLLDDGLIQETVDENDKRAKRLTLTKKGEEAFHQSVNTTSKILSANLKSDEKTKLLELLKKVNDFHYTLYTEYKNSEIKELLHLIE